MEGWRKLGRGGVNWIPEGGSVAMVSWSPTPFLGLILWFESMRTCDSKVTRAPWFGRPSAPLQSASDTAHIKRRARMGWHWQTVTDTAKFTNPCFGIAQFPSLKPRPSRTNFTSLDIIFPWSCSANFNWNASRYGYSHSLYGKYKDRQPTFLPCLWAIEFPLLIVQV